MSQFVQLIKGVVPFTPYPYVGQVLPCNICGSDKKTVLSEVDRRIKKLRTVICLNCGLLRTDPMPTEAELDDYYRLSYRFDYQLAGKKPPKFHLTRSKSLAKRRVEHLKAVITDGTNVLDFGSGSGEFLAECKTHNCTVTGIEPGVDYARFATETYGVKVLSSSWEQTDLGQEKFDLITSFHVFEHLRDPLAALKWLNSHLSTNGVIVLAVPSMKPKSDGNNLFKELHFAHVHGFVPETLDLLAQNCGLELDPRFPAKGTQRVYRKAKAKSRKVKSTAEFASELAAKFGTNDVKGYFFKGDWFTEAFHRLRRDIKDTFKSK